MVSGNPISSAKKRCVGSLQLLMQIEAQPVSSRYRHLQHAPHLSHLLSAADLSAQSYLSTSTPCPGACCRLSVSQAFTALGPMSHWHIRAVTHAFKRQLKPGSGLENIICNPQFVSLSLPACTSAADLP